VIVCFPLNWPFGDLAGMVMFDTEVPSFTQVYNRPHKVIQYRLVTFKTMVGFASNFNHKATNECTKCTT